MIPHNSQKSLDNSNTMINHWRPDIMWHSHQRKYTQ